MPTAVFSYNITTDTYGTPAGWAGGQMFMAEPEADNDQLREYSVKTRLLSVTVGSKGKVKGGGLDFSSVNILCGSPFGEYYSEPNRTRIMDDVAGGAGLPYFGALAVSATDDGGIYVQGLRCMKLNVLPAITHDGEQNKFSISEVEAYAIPRPTLIGASTLQVLRRHKVFEREANWTAPASGAAFKSFFTSQS
jgi:hypothetical protein